MASGRNGGQIQADQIIIQAVSGYRDRVSFGLTFDKVIIIAVIAVFLVGPERLPGYAAQLARLVRAVRTMADGAKVRLRDEMGSDFDEVDWKKLDPRQYDPRRIIREALLEPTEQQAKTELLPNHDDYPAARMDPIDFNEPQPVEEAKAVKAVKAVKPIAREDKLAS